MNSVLYLPDMTLVHKESILKLRRQRMFREDISNKRRSLGQLNKSLQHMPHSLPFFSFGISPASHASQADAPCVFETVPAGHAVQMEEPRREY